MIHAVKSLYAATGNIKYVSRTLRLSEQKVRRILTSEGEYTSLRHDEIVDMLSGGMSIDEVACEIGITRNAVMSYLAYSKGMYNRPDKTVNAQRIALCRARKK